MKLDRRRLGLAAATMLATPAPALAAQEPPFTLERSAVLDVEAGGARYRLTVAWPEGEPPPSGWPVLYVLDGDDNFAAAVATARRLAAVGRRSGVQPGIVVGVTSGDLARRVLDYTPATPGYAVPSGAPAAGLRTGGGEAFLDLMRERIQPLVLQRWGGDPRRQALLGHSFGGLLAVHALYTRSTQFSVYLAVSPSLWFGGDLLERDRRAYVAPENWALTVLLAGSDDARAPSAGPPLDEVATELKHLGVTVHRLPLPGLPHGATMYAAMAASITRAFSAEAR